MDGTKQEYPPLLRLGWHVMDMAQLRQRCVVQFPMSLTRAKIMNGFEIVINQLNKSRLRMEIWVNGSFITEKLNPSDVDFVTRIDGADFDAATVQQKQTLRWLATTNLKAPYRCDAYMFTEYGDGHPLAEFSEWRRAYWLRQFGFSRSDDERGLALIRLPFVVA